MYIYIYIAYLYIYRERERVVVLVQQYLPQSVPEEAPGPGIALAAG